MYERCHKHIDIRIVPSDRERFGRVPVNARLAKESGIAMIGCDCGVNSSDLHELVAVGSEIHKKYNLATLNEVVDRVCVKMAFAPDRCCSRREPCPEEFLDRVYRQGGNLGAKTRIYP